MDLWSTPVPVGRSQRLVANARRLGVRLCRKLCFDCQERPSKSSVPFDSCARPGLAWGGGMFSEWADNGKLETNDAEIAECDRVVK